MSEELHIKAIIDEVDDSKLRQSLAKVQTSTSKALSGGGSGSSTPQTAIDRANVQAGKLQDRFKLLQDVQGKLASQPGMERSLSKVNQEMAGIFAQQKRMSTGVTDYISALNKQVELQKQARNLMNNSDGGSGAFSAHSQRQMAMLQQISAQVPGGGVLNQFISGAGRGAAVAAEGGIGGGGLAGGLAGGGMAAAAGAAALAIAAVGQEMSKLAARAQELSQSASSATSSLGQLRSQTERGKIQQDASAVSSGVTLAGAKQWAEQTGNSIFGGVVDFITGKTPQAKQKDIQSAIAGGLGGNDKEQWRRMKEAGQDLNLDLARQQQGLQIQQYRANRDFAMGLKQFDIDTANQKFDIQKQAQRNEQDYTLAKQQFDEQFQEKQAAKSFALSQQYAVQDFQLNQQRELQGYQINKSRQLQDFSLSMADRSYDFGVSRQRAQTDYTTQRTDTKFDFSRSMSRNQEQFNIDQSRQGADYQENLQKMALSGADGKSFMFASLDYRKQVQRQQEDFARQKKLATEDINTQLGRGDRDFSRQQGYALADFNLSNQRDIRGLNIGQGRNLADLQLSQQRAGQDLGISQQRAQVARQMQLDAEQYSRKYQGIQLEMQHNRNLQDSAIALQRFTQATGMQAQRFANQGADIAQDQSLANRDYAISAYRSLRDYGYQQQDFAGQMRDKNPLGAYGQSLTDPAFAQALARNAAATGQLSLGQQVQSAINPDNTDWGNAIGQLLGQTIPLFGLGAVGFQAGNALFGGGGGNSQNQGGQVNFNPVHNVTFPTVGGVSDADFQALQQQYQRDLQALDSKYASIVNAQLGGNNVFTGY